MIALASSFNNLLAFAIFWLTFDKTGNFWMSLTALVLSCTLFSACLPLPRQPQPAKEPSPE